MRALAVAIGLLASVGPSAAELEPAPRFSGSAGLSVGPQTSADQRFTLNAELAANRTQASGRFALTARLMPDAKAASAICGPLGDALFSNGFEAP